MLAESALEGEDADRYLCVSFFDRHCESRTDAKRTPLQQGNKELERLENVQSYHGKRRQMLNLYR